jgi:hypothetical protein
MQGMNNLKNILIQHLECFGNSDRTTRKNIIGVVNLVFASSVCARNPGSYIFITHLCLFSVQLSYQSQQSNYYHIITK